MPRSGSTRPTGSASSSARLSAKEPTPAQVLAGLFDSSSAHEVRPAEGGDALEVYEVGSPRPVGLVKEPDAFVVLQEDARWRGTVLAWTEVQRARGRSARTERLDA